MIETNKDNVSTNGNSAKKDKKKKKNALKVSKVTHQPQKLSMIEFDFTDTMCYCTAK